MRHDGNVPFAIFRNECYYIAKGVRKIALWDCTFEDPEEVNVALEAIGAEIGYWQNDTFASYSIDCQQIIEERRTKTGKHKLTILHCVIYRKDEEIEKDAAWLLDTICHEHDDEAVRKIGLLLGYAPELVEQFISGKEERLRKCQLMQ